MAMPGFSAEASLATMSKGRWIGAATAQKTTGQGVVPQFYPNGEPSEPVKCEIEIKCIDGIKYSVISCSDGLEFKTEIGVCPPRPWWAQPFHYWVSHPEFWP